VEGGGSATGEPGAEADTAAPAKKKTRRGSRGGRRRRKTTTATGAEAVEESVASVDGAAPRIHLPDRTLGDAPAAEPEPSEPEAVASEDQPEAATPPKKKTRRGSRGGRRRRKPATTPAASSVGDGADPAETAA
jgi:hypothetical protein